ncbi:MAG: CBS domain-containing protein [Lachnospiraceae bacterium]
MKSIKRRWHNEPVNVDCEIEDLILTSMNQNFVPVIDDNKIFIGIIRRKDIIAYCYDRCKKPKNTAGTRYHFNELQLDKGLNSC